jgi:hypothetical protein
MFFGPECLSEGDGFFLIHRVHMQLLCAPTGKLYAKGTGVFSGPLVVSGALEVVQEPFEGKVVGVVIRFPFAEVGDVEFADRAGRVLPNV